MSGSAAAVRRVLICEDSPTYAAALSRLLRWDPEIEVVDVCSSAEATIAAEPGVWVAPDAAHLVLRDDGRLALDAHTDAGLHRPSGDVLLRSLAAHAGPHAVAIVLSGMGRDGADGLGEVARAGGMTIAQDEASSGVFGMPGAAAERGAELILGPAEIGRRLRALRPAGRPS